LLSGKGEGFCFSTVLVASLPLPAADPAEVLKDIAFLTVISVSLNLFEQVFSSL
jgi:hypothetical protein